MKRLFYLIYLMPTLAYSMNSSTIWEWRPATGDDRNGSCFNTLSTGTDYTNQSSSQIGFTQMGTSSKSAVIVWLSNTSSPQTFDPSYVGNCIYMTGGANVFRGFYQINFIIGTTSASLDRSPTPVTANTVGTMTGNLGGATTSFNLSVTSNVAGSVVAGNTLYVKKETWNEAVLISSVSGTDLLPITIEGYNLVRGDAPTPANSADMPRNNKNGVGVPFTWTTFSNYIIKYIWASNSATIGFSGTTGDALLYFVKASNNTTVGISVTTGDDSIIGSELNNNTTRGVLASGNGQYCIFGNYMHDNTTVGLEGTTGGMNASFNVVRNNATNGILMGTGVSIFMNNTVDSNTGGTTDGFNLGSLNEVSVLFNNQITNNGRYGVNASAAVLNLVSDYNNFFGNGTADRNNWPVGLHDKNVNPAYTNADSTDFSVGTLSQNAGWPGNIPGTNSFGMLDIGAIQTLKPFALFYDSTLFDTTIR